MLYSGPVAEDSIGVLRDDEALLQSKRVTHFRSVPAALDVRLSMVGYPYIMVFLLTAMHTDTIG